MKCPFMNIDDRGVKTASSREPVFRHVLSRTTPPSAAVIAIVGLANWNSVLKRTTTSSRNRRRSQPRSRSSFRLAVKVGMIKWRVPTAVA
ncbi:MAG: hypothetical protein JWP08_2409 [Bryobacterales bacterium]|nr:hypothetical protein [Bryobacterales bacterium]